MNINNDEPESTAEESKEEEVKEEVKIETETAQVTDELKEMIWKLKKNNELIINKSLTEVI